MQKLFSLAILSLVSTTLFSQQVATDSSAMLSSVKDSIVLKKNEQLYHLGKGKTYIYTKPKSFSFLTNLPKDFAGIASAPFKKNAIKPILIIAASSAALILADQTILDGVKRFTENIGLSGDEKYKDILTIRAGSTNINLYKAPQNLNTAIYQLGQGFPSLLLGGGLYVYGKIHKDYRAISTANQLAEAFILMGVSTQIVKRITGRQTPVRATSNGGDWNFFPAFKDYQKNTPNYDAFPSGHLATLASTVTILTENYPEKKWIKPVGYSITALVGFSMINNKVHWAGDYPVALALGYLCAKQVVKRSRRVVSDNAVGISFVKKPKGEFSYSFNYNNGVMMPGFVYKF
jgi:membrane-associated phospholipid phosphatase